MSNKEIEKALQQAVVDLNALAIQGKQLHWNLQGRHFLSLHEQLDIIVDDARLSGDELAERMVQIGFSPDGREATIAQTTSLKPLEPGYIDTAKAYEIAEEALMLVSDTLKKSLSVVDDSDPLSGDLLIAAAQKLEKQAWMLRAHQGKLG